MRLVCMVTALFCWRRTGRFFDLLLFDCPVTICFYRKADISRRSFYNSIIISYFIYYTAFAFSVWTIGSYNKVVLSIMSKVPVSSTVRSNAGDGITMSGE